MGGGKQTPRMRRSVRHLSHGDSSRRGRRGDVNDCGVLKTLTTVERAKNLGLKVRFVLYLRVESG